MDKIKKFLFENKNIRQTIIKNVIWLSSGVTISRIVRSLMIIYAARVLGTEHYGIFSYALSLAAVFSIFSDIGLSNLLTRELVKNSIKEKREYLATSFSLKMSLVSVTALIIAFISPIFTNIADAKPLMLIMAALIAFDSIRGFLFSISRAENRMQFEATFEIITEIFITTIGFVILTKAPSAANFASGYALASGLSMLVVLVVMRNYISGTFTYFRKKLVGPIIKSAWPFAVMGVFGVFLTNIDSVIIGYFRPVGDLGLYAAAQKPISMFYLIPGFLYVSLFPFISKFIKDGEEKKLSILLRKSIIVSLGLALPIVLGGIIIAGPLINVVYGHDYIGATSTFQILLLTLLPIFPGMILASTLLAEDKQKTFIKSSAVGAGLNIILDLILIPKYGIAGSAIATLIAQLAVNGIFLYEILKNHNLNIWKDMKKIIVASCVMALVVFAMKSLLWPIISIVLISPILYFGLLFIQKEEVLGDIRQGFKI